MATPATPSYMRKIQPLTERKSWTALQAHYQEIHGQHLKELFAADPQRGNGHEQPALFERHGPSGGHAPPADP